MSFYIGFQNYVGIRYSNYDASEFLEDDQIIEIKLYGSYYYCKETLKVSVPEEYHIEEDKWVVPYYKVTFMKADIEEEMYMFEFDIPQIMNQKEGRKKNDLLGQLLEQQKVTNEKLDKIINLLDTK